VKRVTDYRKQTLSGFMMVLKYHISAVHRGWTRSPFCSADCAAMPQPIDPALYLGYVPALTRKDHLLGRPLVNERLF
jgi:hypothetical protein